MNSNTDISAKYTSALADYVLTHGVSQSSLRPMAKAAGTSDRMLVYHFGSKAGVMNAARRDKAAMDAMLPAAPLPANQLMPMIGAVMTSGAFNPSIAVLLELTALAMRGDAAAKKIANTITSDFHDWLAARLTEPDRAIELLAAVEGWGILTGCGLDAPFPSG
jgi:AcrR family transcriptional regulator